MVSELSWTAHPARSRPRDTAFVAAVLLLSMGAVSAAFQSLYLTILAAAILVAAIAPFLFPTRYELDDWGIKERRLGRHRERAWTELRRMEIGQISVTLSPFRRASWMDRYRGLMVFFDGADREQLIAVLEDRIVIDA